MPQSQTLQDSLPSSNPSINQSINQPSSIQRASSSLDGSSGECPEHRRKRVARQSTNQSTNQSILSNPVSSEQYASIIQAFTQSHNQSTNQSTNQSIGPSFNLPSDVGIVLADAHQNITHVNQSFESITGYSRSDSIGRNCNFLQGKNTSINAKQSMRLAINQCKTVQLPVLNYRKNGVPFWNLLTIAPMLDSEGRVCQYIGVQVPQSVIYVDRPLATFPWSNEFEPKSAPVESEEDEDINQPINESLPKLKQLSHTKSMTELDTYRTKNHVIPFATTIPEETESPVDEMLLEPPSLIDDLAADSTDSESSVNSSAEHDAFVNERRKSIDQLRHDVAQLHMSENSPSSPSINQSSNASSSQSLVRSSHALPSALNQSTPVSFVAETLLPTAKGKLRVRAYKDLSALGAREHREIMVIYHGDLRNAVDVPTRVHDACFTSEVLHSLKCDCRQQLDFALEFIQTNPSKCGMVIYMPQEGRGIGLANKIKVYSVQEKGYDTVDANRILGFPDDLREYTAVPSILTEMGVNSIQLMTNNPRKSRILAALGVNITSRIPVIMDTNEHSKSYIAAKRARMGHFAE